MNKEELLQKARDRLAALQADIDKLEARLQTTSDEVRSQARAQMDKAREAAGELRERISDVQDAAEDRLRELRDKVDAVADKAMQRLNELRNRLG